eukprot:scaffold1525_cov254-Pinguiococcus_pyrenoidosus.AAC.5
MPFASIAFTALRMHPSSQGDPDAKTRNIPRQKRNEQNSRETRTQLPHLDSDAFTTSGAHARARFRLSRLSFLAL